MSIGVGFTRLGLIGIPRGQHKANAFAGKSSGTPVSLKRRHFIANIGRGMG